MFTELFIEDVLVTIVTMDRGTTLGRDGTQLQCNRVLSLLPMLNSVVVGARAIIIAPSAAKMAASHAQPKIRL